MIASKTKQQGLYLVVLQRVLSVENLIDSKGSVEERMDQGNCPKRVFVYSNVVGVNQD